MHTEKTKHNRIYRFIRPVVLFLGTLVILSMAFLNSHGKIVTEATAVKGMTITLKKWTKITSFNDVKGGRDSHWKGILMWWDDSNNWVFTKGSSWSGNNYIGTNINVDCYIGDGFSREFYTRTDHSCLRFDYMGKDGDNEGADKYHIRFSNGRYLYTTFDDDLSASSSADNWTIMDYNQQCRKKGCPEYYNAFIMFYNRSGADDTQVYHSGNKFYGRDSDGGWKLNDFYIFQVTDAVFDACGDYTIAKDQILRCDSTTFLLEDKTLKIEKGGVFSVHGDFFCNGTIDCAGTIVVESDGKIMPYSPTGSAGNIRLHDGGTLIISHNGRVLAGNPEGCLNATKPGFVQVDDGYIYNYGLFVAGYITLNNGAVVENHDGGNMALGCGVKNSFTDFQNVSIMFDKPWKGGLSSQGDFSTPRNTTAIFRSYKGSRYQIGNSSHRPLHFYSIDEKGNETYSVRKL